MTNWSIEFGDFQGRSLILEAGEIIALNSIRIDIPVAYGYPVEVDETGAIQQVSLDRERNFPESLLSISAGINLTEPQAALFIDSSILIDIQLPDFITSDSPHLIAQAFDAEVQSILEAIIIGEPTSTYSSADVSVQILQEGANLFTVFPRYFEFPFPVGEFQTNPPDARLIALSSPTDGGLGNGSVSLTEINNPLNSTPDNTPPPSTSTPTFNSLSTDDFSQDFDTVQSGRGGTLDLDQEEEQDTLNAKKCSDKKATDKDYLTSLACYSSGIERAAAEPTLEKKSNELYDLAVLYYQNSQFLESLETYQERLELALLSQDRLAEIQTIQGLSKVYAALGNYDLALQANQNAFGLLEYIQQYDSSEVTFLRQSITNNFAFISYAKGDYKVAADNYLASLQLARQTNDTFAEIEALSQLGLSYFQQTNYEQAKKLQKEALELAKQIQSSTSQLQVHEGLAITEYALGNYGMAIQEFEKALTLAEQLGDRHAAARHLSGLGDAQFKNGQNEASVKSLLTSIELLEELRRDLEDADLFKVSMFETQETTYSILQEVLLEQNQFEAALEMIERGRSRAFVDLLSRSYNLDAEVIEDVEVETPDIESIRQIAKEQNSTITSYSIARQIQEIQGERKVVEVALWIWVVQPDGSVHFRKRDLADLRQQGMTITDLIIDSRCFGDPMCLELRQEEMQYENPLFWEWEDDALDPYLQTLHSILIEPIADLLPNTPEEQVIFVPHRSLFMVPFAALQDANGKYLVESHTIRTTPSIQVLDLTHQQNKTISSEGIAIVGNPTMPGGLKQLPGSETEAAAIAEMFGSESILIGDAATESAVIDLIQNRRFIHLASHGLLDAFAHDGRQEVPGAIALTPTETSDGFLTTSEIFNLRLNSEMIVLSACDTGRGQITEDGVIGLSRAFMAAGIPSVVVSLWQVPDEATSDLMIEFYNQLQVGEDKAKALRKAMLHNLEKYEYPQDWAAFTLLGES